MPRPSYIWLMSSYLSEKWKVAQLFFPDNLRVGTEAK